MRFFLTWGLRGNTLLLHASSSPLLRSPCLAAAKFSDHATEVAPVEVTREQVLTLYLKFLRVSRKIKSYNVASYIRRRARRYFEENRGLKTPAEISRAYAFGLEQYKIASLYDKITSNFDVRPSVIFKNRSDLESTQ